MSMYLFVPGIPGSTTAQGYVQWIPILAMNWGAGRVIETGSGYVVDRIHSNTTGLEMEIIKPMDQASPLFFAQVWGSRAIPEVKIHACYGGSNAFVPYLQCTLSNVMVSEYSAHVDADESLELIALNYTDIEHSYTEFDAQGLPNSPSRAQAQIGSRPSITTQFRREVNTRTDEGFTLFVATVYGEMAGVRHSRELAWQAVGSVILNRVGKSIWHRFKTTDEIIKSTGFDAYMNLQKIKNWDNVNFKTPPVKGHEQFVKAWAFYHHQFIHHRPALTDQELKKIENMKNLLHPIYYQNKVITQANFYYSPRGMHGKKPSFLVGIDNPEQYKEYLSGLDDNEITLYNIPPRVIRQAGERMKQEKK